MFCKKAGGPGANPGSGPQAPKALAVETLVATPEVLSADIKVPGTILANESTEIHPEIAGRMVELNIREGTNVAQGTLLAKLYDGDLQAQLRKLEVQLKIADQTEKRQAELVKIQGISQQEYDLSLLQVLNLKADMDIIKEAIRKTEIRAPFSGKLGLKNVSPGGYITPSTIITTISQVNTLKIQFNIPERYGAKLKPGQTVTFNVDGSSRTYVASIIASEISIDEDTRSLAVRALVKQPDASLIPGVFAEVKIVLGKNEEALMVPNNAIIPLGRKKQLYLYQGGKAMVQEVTTGVRDSTNIQILTGIKVGDTVITSAVLFLRPGLEVTIAKSN
ncbi:MAG: efflux RND transporter periplasmic adaptor subunit [Saprospiraceae bacterium]|nr:efflux RND transporter periplasmic adaptor subunit [Candidatus Opimibacter iunctus]